MKTAWRVGLAVGAVLLVIGGIYYLSYGATYYGVYYSDGKGAPCLYDCTSLYTGITVVFVGYPIWSPPSWNHVNYSAPLCPATTVTTYSPQNPPPSCSYPPANFSSDYGRNYGGGFLLVLGALAAIVAIRSRDAARPEPSSTAP
jgi:hypothetical protein